MAREKDDILKQKAQTLKRLFDDEWLLIHVDTRAPSVMVPEHLRNLSSITFKLSRLFQGTTDIGDNSVSAQLLFGTTRHECLFPFDAIWGATSVKGSNIVWPESAPAEILSQIEKGTLEVAKQPSESKMPKSRPSQEEKKRPIQKGHLTRIK